MSITIPRILLAIAITSNLFASEIPRGAHVLLQMVNSISTRSAREGDYVYLKTATPVIVDGKTVVPVGSFVQGIVTQSKRSGRVKGRAGLAIRLDTLSLPTGQVLKVTPRMASVDSNDTDQRVDENTIKQGSTHGKDAEQIAILAGSGAAIGGLADRSWKGAGIGAGVGSGVGLATVLLSRGKEVDLHQGTSMDVVFDRPITLE